MYVVKSRGRQSFWPRDQISKIFFHFLRKRFFWENLFSKKEKRFFFLISNHAFFDKLIEIKTVESVQIVNVESRDPRTADLVQISKGVSMDPRTDLVGIFERGWRDPPWIIHGPSIWSNLIKGRAWINGPSIWFKF